VELATRLLSLAAAAAESLTIAERPLDPSVMAADAAESLSLERGVDYRTAYREVGRAVAAGERVGGDAREAIATRIVTGGAAPAPMDAMLASCEAEIAVVSAQVDASRATIAAAERELLRLARG
jgi:argininosuccinate lyase